MNAPLEDAQPEVSSETPRPERVIVQPGADSRLESLHALYNSYKQDFQDAKERFESLKKSIVAELEKQYTEDDRPSHAYEVPASAYGPALTIYYKSSEYMPDSAIRDNFPDIWDQFHREKKYSEVRESQAGKSRGGRRGNNSGPRALSQSWLRSLVTPLFSSTRRTTAPLPCPPSSPPAQLS
jgi:hypothetical protein